MNVVDADVVIAKLAELELRMGRVREKCPETAVDLAQDQDILDIVSFNLVLAVQSCVDIASHLISDEQWTPAMSLADAFVRLGERGVLAEETAGRMKSAAGMRNILAHVYARVDPARVHIAATMGLQDMESFRSEVGVWLRDRLGQPSGIDRK